jgi:hypothetical protein
MQTFGGETTWKMSTLKTEKDLRANSYENQGMDCVHCQALVLAVLSLRVLLPQCY